MKNNLMNFVSHVLILSVLSLSLWIPNARAGMISTEQVIAGQPAELQREHLCNIFDRKDVRAQLQARGVSADMVSTRVDALTDDEVATLNGKLDSLPAGGDIVGAAVFVFIVLLVTDILGLTKVFSFTKSIRR